MRRTKHRSQSGPRRRLFVVIVATVIALVGAAVVVIANIGRTTNGRGTDKARLQTFAADFTGVSGNVLDLKSPTGQPYMIRDLGHTGLEVRHERLVRTDRSAAHFGSMGSPILLSELPREPSTMSVTYSFTAGQTARQSVSVGSCAEAFGDSSVQAAVSPSTWVVFLTKKRSDGVEFSRLAQGRYATPLRADGTTSYSTSMTFDPTTSTVRARLPGGIAKTITDPRIAQYWGGRMGVQITHPNQSDGDAQIRGFSAGVKRS